MIALPNPRDASHDLTAFENDRTDQLPLNLGAFGIGSDQLQALDQLGTLVAAHLDGIVDRVLQPLAEIPQSDPLYAHARTLQRTHWVGMLSSKLDDGHHATSCARIGATHFHNGLPFELLMVSHAQAMAEMQTIAIKACTGHWGGVRPGKLGPLLDALSRVFVMDMERTASAFFNAERAHSMARLQDLSAILEEDIGKIVQGVSAAAVELSTTSDQMVQAGGYTRSETATTSKLADEMEANAQSVASAVEQLSASIRMISGQLTESTAVTKRARVAASSAGETVQDLDKAVGDISTVLEMISSIAKQTNLLALNATVEAARSGDAGRGFAVVALEIKSLSERISGATKEIDTRISHIRSRTKEAVAGTQTFGEAITSLDATTSSIAAAVAQQSTATQDISGSADATALRTSRMAESMQKVDRAVTDIAGSAEEVSKAAGALRDQALDVQNRTAEFAEKMSRI